MESARPSRSGVRSLLASLLLALLGAAAAQNCAIEAEPNDTPAQAVEIGDRLCLAGDLIEDSQDAWFWTVTEEMAATPWRIEIEGIRGQLTQIDVVDVEFAEDGVGVLSADTLTQFGTTDGRLATSGPFLVGPGRYLLGISKSGGSGEYVVHLRPDEERFRRPADLAATEAREGPFLALGGIEAEHEIEWTLGEEDAAHRWGLVVNDGLLDTTRVALEGPDGTVVEGRTSGGRVEFHALGLDAGTYRLRLEGPSGVVAVEALREGRLTDGNEVEPNDAWDEANVLTLDAPLEGNADGRDRYVVDVAEADAGPWTLVVETSDDVRVELYDAERELLQERRGRGVELADLQLAAGAYGVQVRDGDDGPYTIRFERGAAPREGFEAEPNDALHAATPLTDDLTIRGELAAGDEDAFRFRVEGEPQLWRVQAIGDGVDTIARYNGGGVRQQETDGRGRVRLDNVQLLGGEHYLRLSGGEGPYALRLLPLGPAPEPPPPAEAEAADAPLEAAEAAAAPSTDDATVAAAPEPPAADPGPPPPPGWLEREPNDDSSRSERLRPGDVRVGTLSDGDDRDRYRFFLANEAYVEIEAVPPEGGRLRATLVDEGRATSVGPSVPARILRRLPPGDHEVVLRAEGDVAGYYQLRMRLRDPIAVPIDAEPNDRARDAVRLPASLAWTASPGDLDVQDYYRLPRFDRPAVMTLTLTDDGGGRLPNVGVYADEGDAPRPEEVEEGTWRLEIPPNRDLTLRLRGRGEHRYRAEASFDTEPPPGELRPDPNAGASELEIAAEATDVTAYWHEGQRVPATVTIRNAGDAAATLDLSAHVSDAAATVELPDEQVHVGAGAEVEVPVVVRLPDDLRDDAPIHVTVAARSEGSVDTATLALQPRCEAAPVGAFPYWSVPEGMLGGLNVLNPVWGARPTSDVGGRVAQFFDGVTAPSTGGYVAPGEAVTVELPGDEPIALAGALLHPQSRGSRSSQLRSFRIETSLDGVGFETAFEGELRAARIEQAFVFDAPVRARHARLVFVDNQGGENHTYLGEWKLVAAPEAGPAAVGAREVNLLDPRLGGHVVWSRPYVGSGDAMLVDEDAPGTVDARGLDELAWAVGFQHHRAARVAELRWTPDPEADPERRIERVTVEYSTTGGAGPWTPLAEWELDPASDGTSVLELDAPPWARVLRFEALIQEDQRYYALPKRLEAIEALDPDGPSSIVGEWGHYRREAAFEHAATAAEEAELVALDEDAGETLEAAYALRNGDRISGSVLVAEDVDWYRIEPAESHNAVELRLSGDPQIAYDYALVDAEGAPVPAEIVEEGEDVVLTAFPEDGAPIFLRLEEPMRSVVFSWDTSGSVSPYQAITYNSLAGFAREVDAEREYVQLLAYDVPKPTWLLPYWSSDPERVQTAINTFDRRADSSNSETALLEATRALADRDGTRAVLLMTDAETFSRGLTPDLWEALEEVRPRIFTFEISTAGSAWTQDLMQSWASVNHGYYDYTRNVSDFDVGFARAACHLRRAKRYELRVATRFEEPPGPGQLRVVRGEDVALPAVEVIFDASGSMGAALPDGTAKIAAAKGVLNELVGEILPEGVPFALRAFGHLTPQSCESRLDLPLAPLDREAARAAIDAIQPKLLSQTPIADALAQVGGDLGGTDASKTVVLITDGEESCGGDPAAAVEALQDEGVDVRLSVVSLGVDDAGARQAFADLAELGGGAYVPAEDTASLRASVEEALNPPYQVLDAAGEVVGEGRLDGEPVTLPMGAYAVRIPGAPPTLLRDVRVPGDGAVTVTYEGP